MTDANPEAPAAAPAKASAEKKAEEEEEAADKKEEDKTTEEKKDDGPPPEERVANAEKLKEEGNGLLKAGNPAGAAEKYREGIALAEPLLEKTVDDLGQELQQRNTAAYTALRLNCAQACLKTSSWVEAAEHAEKVLLLDKDNTKALYRRGLASVELNTEGRLEQAKTDFTRLATLEPSNREARTQLAKAKQGLQECRQHEKRRLSLAMGGGLYQEQHDKVDKLQAAYDAEVKRREEAEEDKITYEDWVKKEKEREEEKKRKDKEEREKQQKEQQEKKLREAHEAELVRRKDAGEDPITYEDWIEELKAKEEESRRSKIGGVMRTDEFDLDADEKKLLEETKSKGYYHGRLGTVLSDEAPKPQQVDANSVQAPQDGKVGSEWNDAGTWEEKDMTVWVKERLTACLGKAHVSSEVTLPGDKTATATAKVSKVKTLNGTATVVTVRKKLKHGYQFEAELSFSISFKSEEEGVGGSYSGALSLPELMDFISPAELRMDARWKGTAPSGPLAALTFEWLEKLRTSVREQVGKFLQEYQQKR